MKSYLQEGDQIDVTLSASVTGGIATLVGAAMFGVPMIDGVSGDTVTLVREGVFSDQPKKAGEAWAVGDKLYWDNTAKNFTTTATNNLYVGIARDAALAADTTGVVVLDRRVG
ncbi:MULTISPECIES: DUF2190 family protein [unclassified Bradyrhizobium]|uniref:DUF2190 family protein n=1 Tax=unclassified Bradyrhizobium TaxID=2631580 RepID=UPI002916EFA5|nr:MULTISPECIES: DUF2190 family protein [unclassified Bradyrhizobium]